MLSADEERDLAGRSAAGDVTARHRLIEAHLGLSFDVARPFARRGVPLDDLVQEANLGLIRASADFDPIVQGCRFAAYAEIWARAFVHRALMRDAKWPAREPAHAGPTADAFGWSYLFIEPAIRRLSPVEAWVIRERYGIGKSPDGMPSAGLPRTWMELADACGLSPRRLEQIEVAALEKMRAVLTACAEPRWYRPSASAPR